MNATSPHGRKKAHDLGILAERIAVVILRLKGYCVLARRYQVRGGEIDIVAWRGDAVYVAPWHWPRHEVAAIELDLG